MIDKKLKSLIAQEVKRQAETIDLIPSENYASPEILDVVGSPLMNKYSEGYPGKRYYPGNFYYDEIEKLAQDRALKAFSLSGDQWGVNVQPYSGSPANLAIYSALMEFGDTLMGLKLDSGGHLTHGHKVNFSGKAYKVVHYGVEEKTGLIDYEELEKLAKENKPKIIVSGLTAYPRKIDFERIGKIAKSVGAYHLADVSHIAGLILAGLHQSPFDSAQGKPHADVVMTTTHKTLRGPRGAVIYSKKEKVKNEKSDILISDAIDKAVFPGMQGGPHNNSTAAKALMFFEASQPAFKKYQEQVLKNSKKLSLALLEKGFKLLTGGTDNHLLVLDLSGSATLTASGSGLDGKMAEKMLEANNINANRNSIPGDPSPLKPSGVRIGTPAVTTRGMKEKEMEKIADWIWRILIKKESVLSEVKKLCGKFPLAY
ncbi:MAG: serine hydroxymethyltransferase [bacterium]|nr:serine hydroxymethyltransferase [bacterium]